jgi:hypothetical protein
MNQTNKNKNVSSSVTYVPTTNVNSISSIPDIFDRIDKSSTVKKFKNNKADF